MSKGSGRSALELFALFCRLYQLNQGSNFVLGGSIKTGVPLCLGEFSPEVDLNGKVRFPAGYYAGAREVTSLSFTVGKRNLPPQPGTPGL